MRSIPLALQTGYQDLLETQRQQALSEIGGTPFLKDTGGKGAYWYARQRIGDRVVDRYLGRDTPDLRIRLEKAVDDLETQKALNKRCASLVAQLRAAGLPALDRESGKVLNAMARVGVFRLGGTLVGTHAYRLMSAELGVWLDDALAVTEDLDIAAFENLKLVIEDKVDPDLPDTFRGLNLTAVPGLDARRPTRWHMPGGGARIDFLVPLMKEGNEAVFLEPLGVYAQALSFLNFLIADPIPAAGLYRSGVLLQIPRPERYAIHKLIVAQRRTGGQESKARKDLAQAESLIRVLAEDRPYDLQSAWQTALNSGEKWREAIDRSLRQKPDIAATLRGL